MVTGFCYGMPERVAKSKNSKARRSLRAELFEEGFNMIQSALGRAPSQLLGLKQYVRRRFPSFLKCLSEAFQSDGAPTELRADINGFGNKRKAEMPAGKDADGAIIGRHTRDPQIIVGKGEVNRRNSIFLERVECFVTALKPQERSVRLFWWDKPRLECLKKVKRIRHEFPLGTMALRIV
jgi:hypothetical protein